MSEQLPQTKPTFKLGKDLKVGDAIRFWVDSRGMRVVQLHPYKGIFTFVCCSADLVSVNADNAKSVTTTIEANMQYEIL